jgi:hypothetical protein
MVPIESTLENLEESFGRASRYLHTFDFTLGGNWDYEHGFFDHRLDGEAQKVWLRIPFQVTRGVLDGDTDATDATIQLGTPFVLKHVYNEGLDREAQPRTFGGLIDQFADPLDKDAPVEEDWVEKGRELLRKVEAGWI